VHVPAFNFGCCGGKMRPFCPILGLTLALAR